MIRSFNQTKGAIILSLVLQKREEMGFGSNYHETNGKFEQLDNNNGKARGSGRTKISVTKVNEQCNKGIFTTTSGAN